MKSIMNMHQVEGGDQMDAEEEKPENQEKVERWGGGQMVAREALPQRLHLFVSTAL